MPGKSKSHKKSKSKEHFVPGPLSGTPDPDSSVPEPMGPPPSSMAKTEAVALHDFFPLPGETAEPEEWAKAFTLEGSQVPQMMRPDGSVPVGGKSTLWRKVQVPSGSSGSSGFSPSPSSPPSVNSAAPITHPVSLPVDIQNRLDTLTRQLDSLTAVTPMQSTAELFLFVAIGLLFLLAIDTLLRCATTVALAKKGNTGQNGGGFLSRHGGARGLNKAWRFF